jgi:hypothetical protein
MTQAANLAALGTNAGTTGTFPATSLTGVVPYASMPTGSVLQAVTFYDQTYVTTASTSYSDLPLTLNITPKYSTSKIMVIANVFIGASGGRGTSLRLVRNSTTIMNFANGAGQLGGTSAYTNLCTGYPITYIDSPASTSAVTYKIQWAAISGSGLYNWYDNNAYTASSITLLEIAG